jgi:hypothetical protein
MHTSTFFEPRPVLVAEDDDGVVAGLQFTWARQAATLCWWEGLRMWMDIRPGMISFPFSYDDSASLVGDESGLAAHSAPFLTAPEPSLLEADSKDSVGVSGARRVRGRGEERCTNLLTRRFSGDDPEMNGRIERDWIHLALVPIVPLAERRHEGGRARSF